MIRASSAKQRRTCGIDDETTANLGTIQGGRSGNIVPNEVVVRGEARFLVVFARAFVLAFDREHVGVALLIRPRDARLEQREQHAQRQEAQPTRWRKQRRRRI